MQKNYKAVILLAQVVGTTTPAPDLSDCSNALLNHPHSPYHFWNDVTEGWVNFTSYDFIGWLMVTPSSSNIGRWEMSNLAINEAQRANFNLDAYDVFIVLWHSDDSFDSGAVGGNRAIIQTRSDLAFYCHEIGHALGLGHTYGNLYEYGDPYDIMSAYIFGYASPSFNETSSNTINGFPGLFTLVGPALCKASLHYYWPDALESQQRAVHVNQRTQDIDISILTAAGAVNPGEKCLIVIHPDNEDVHTGLGRIYIELRANEGFDLGLGRISDGSHPGVVIHAIRDVGTNPGSPQVVVNYERHVTHEELEVSIVVPEQSLTLSVTLGSNSAQITVHPRALLALNKTDDEYRSIEFTSMRSDNQFGIPFRWLIYATYTRSSYRIIPKQIYVNEHWTNQIPATPAVWRVAGINVSKLNETQAGLYLSLPDGSKIGVGYSINAKNELNLYSFFGTKTASFEVIAETTGTHVAGDGPTASTFDVYGEREGWGDDYYHFLDLMWRTNHRYPKPRFGPPPVELIRFERERFFETYAKIKELNLEAAAAVEQKFLSDVARISTVYVDAKKR